MMFCPLIKDECKKDNCMLYMGDQEDGWCLVRSAAQTVTAPDAMTESIEDIVYEIKELQNGFGGIIQTLYDR